MDVSLLTLLCSTGKQQNELFTIPAEIHAIAWANINPKLEDACTDALNIRQVATFQSVETRNDSGGCFDAQAIKPFAKGTATLSILIFEEHYQCRMVTLILPLRIASATNRRVANLP